MVRDELRVDGLGLGVAAGALENAPLLREALRCLGALWKLAHEPVERGHAHLPAPALLQPRELEEPRRAALGRQIDEGAVDGGQRGIVAARAARRGDHDLELPREQLRGQLAIAKRLGLAPRRLAETRGEQALGALEALARRR